MLTRDLSIVFDLLMVVNRPYSMVGSRHYPWSINKMELWWCIEKKQNNNEALQIARENTHFGKLGGLSCD